MPGLPKATARKARQATSRRGKPGRGLLTNIGRGLAAAAAIVFAAFAYAYLTLPDTRSLAATNPGMTAFMELRAREARLKAKDPRRVQQWVSYRQISPLLIRAVLVTEDAAFWDHEGVDFEQLRESIKVDWARGRFVRGASTLTQQLAKNLYLSPSRNPLRKFRELIIARRLEATMKKTRILELYLNVIEWGDGIYGAEAAARTYFSVPAASLGASQAALLAGAIANPRLLNPAKPTRRLLSRQQIILKRMGKIVEAGPTPAQPGQVITPEPPLPPIEDDVADPETEALPAGTALEPAIPPF